MLSIERITVKGDRVSLLVRCASLRYVTPSIAAKASEVFPRLSRHACVNDAGPRFGDVMESTSLPHLLEHLIIDLQAQSGGAAYMGITEWVDEKFGLARVEVSYADDMVALRAVKEAARFLNEILPA